MKISDYKNVGIIFNKDSGLINDDSLYRSIKSELGSNEKCILRFIDLEDSEELYEFYGGFKKICITELKKCDVVIVFGGDGTKNFVANMLIHYNIDIPILGISCGTMNVGKLTSICDNEFFMNNEYDIIHFLRREMLDFTAFPVFFVSNLLLVQRKKYYFNRATVSRNCSIVL